jgi:hypothetical protein
MSSRKRKYGLSSSKHCFKFFKIWTIVRWRMTSKAASSMAACSFVVFYQKSTPLNCIIFTEIFFDIYRFLKKISWK